MAEAVKAEEVAVVFALIEGLQQRSVQSFEGLGIKVNLYPSSIIPTNLDPELPPSREAARDAATLALKALQDEEDMLNWST